MICLRSYILLDSKVAMQLHFQPGRKNLYWFFNNNGVGSLQEIYTVLYIIRPGYPPNNRRPSNSVSFLVAGRGIFFISYKQFIDSRKFQKVHILWVKVFTLSHQILAFVDDSINIS